MRKDYLKEFLLDETVEIPKQIIDLVEWYTVQNTAERHEDIRAFRRDLRDGMFPDWVSRWIKQHYALVLKIFSHEECKPMKQRYYVRIESGHLGYLNYDKHNLVGKRGTKDPMVAKNQVWMTQFTIQEIGVLKKYARVIPEFPELIPVDDLEVDRATVFNHEHFDKNEVHLFKFEEELTC